MLARLQRFLILGGAGLAIVWLSVCARVGNLHWGLFGAASLLGGYALVLGLELLFLRYAARDGQLAPEPTIGQLLGAWWGEVCSAPLVFAWRQPFRSQRWPDQLPVPCENRRGVLLVHGFFCNRGLWNAWMAGLTAQHVPFVAVNLEPLFGSIDSYTVAIEEAVSQLQQCTGKAPVIVAHSMGDLAVRRWWADQPDPMCVHRLVTLGTPHQGTWLARFAFSVNGVQMQRRSPWLAALVAKESPQLSTHITCFYSHCDNIVFPASTASLPGADNIHLPGVAHVHMVDQPQPWQEVMRWLKS